MRNIFRVIIGVVQEAVVADSFTLMLVVAEIGIVAATVVVVIMYRKSEM